MDPKFFEGGYRPQMTSGHVVMQYGGAWHMRAFHIHMIKEKCLFPLHRDTLRASQAAGRYNDPRDFAFRPWRLL